jgi:hypothetical protein
MPVGKHGKKDMLSDDAVLLVINSRLTKQLCWIMRSDTQVYPRFKKETEASPESHPMEKVLP